MSAEVSLLSAWRPFNKIARTAKSGQNKRVHWEQPEICSWARISHSSSGRNPKRNSCLSEAVIKYSACPMGNPKQSNKTSFLFRFCSNTGIFGGKVEFLVKSLEMEQVLLMWDAGRRRNYKIMVLHLTVHSIFLRIPESQKCWRGLLHSTHHSWEVTFPVGKAVFIQEMWLWKTTDGSRGAPVPRWHCQCHSLCQLVARHQRQM